MSPSPRPLARAVHHALTAAVPTSAPPPQGGFSLVETIVTAALVTVLAAGVYTVYQPTAGLAQVETQTALLDQLKTNVERSYGSSTSYSAVSFSVSSSNQQTVPNWIPTELTTPTNWGGVTIGPAQTNVANDSWTVSFPTVPTHDCQQAVIHELNNWSTITVNGTVVSDTPSTLDACASTTSGQNVVAFVDYGGPLGYNDTALCSASDTTNCWYTSGNPGAPSNPPPGMPTPPVQAPNPGPPTAPPSSLPTTPSVGLPASPSPSGPGVSQPPPPGVAPAPTYPATCVVPSPQTQTLACPSGQLGTLTQNRSASCPDPYGTAVWGPWTTSVNTCAPVCVAPPSGSANQSATCPSGQVTSAGAASFTQSQSITYTCPAPTGSYTTAYGPWSPTTASACAPQCVAPSPTTGTQTASCPSGQVTSTGAASFTQTQPITYSCASPQGAYTTTPGAWSPAVSSACAPKCVAPSPTTGSETQTASCPAGQVISSGAASFTQTATRSVTYSCPAPQGTYTTAYGAWSAWSPTAASVCAPQCVAPSPTTQSQGVTVSCPGGQVTSSGATSFGATETRSVTYGCPSPQGTYTTAYGAWSGPSPAASSVCAPQCVAPGPSSVTNYEWVNETAGCPTGYTGSITYQLQFSDVTTTTYACPSPQGSYTSGTSTTPWVSTGVTQNTVNTCHINCVSPDSFVVVLRQNVEQEIRAGEVVKGDELRLISPVSGEKRWGRVSVSHRDRAERVLITTAQGLTLTCSVSAPIGVLGGGSVLAKDLLGQVVVAEVNGQFLADEVVNVKPLGEGDVQLITCENDFFLAGDQSGRYLAHHNKKLGQCVSLEAWLWVRDRRGEHHVQAIDIHPGDEVRIMNPATGELGWSRVGLAKLGHAECVRVETTSGVTLTCSTGAPLGLIDGDSTIALILEGQTVGAWKTGAYTPTIVKAVHPVGLANVRNIEVEEGFFLVGDHAGQFLTHEG